MTLSIRSRGFIVYEVDGVKTSTGRIMRPVLCLITIPMVDPKAHMMHIPQCIRTGECCHEYADVSGRREEADLQGFVFQVR